MTEKQFKVTNISENGNTGLFWLGKDNLSVYDVVRLLNELYDENNELTENNEQLKFDKQQLHMAMSREVVRHKEFKDKAFDLIDAKIKEYQKYDGYDTEKYYIGTQLLNELKRELQE